MASCAACGRAAVSNRVVVRPKSLGVGPGALCFARVGTPRRGAEFYRLPVRLLLAGRRAEVGPGGDGGGEEGEAKRPLRRDGAGGWAGGRRGGRRRREASAFPPPGASAGHAPRATRALWAGGLAAGPAARLSREGGGRRAAAPCGRTSARRRPRRTASSAHGGGSSGTTRAAAASGGVRCGWRCPSTPTPAPAPRPPTSGWGCCVPAADPGASGVAGGGPGARVRRNRGRDRLGGRSRRGRASPQSPRGAAWRARARAWLRGSSADGEAA